MASIPFLRRRKSKKKRPEETGVVYAAPEGGGRASSLSVNHAIVIAAIAAADSDLAARVGRIHNWRKGYHLGINALTRRGLDAPEDALAMARAGIEAAYTRFAFSRDGDVMSLPDAYKRFTEARFQTVEIQGSAPPATALDIPYLKQTLSGATLKAQLDAWVAADIIEPSAAAALSALGTSTWDLSGIDIVMLGASAEVGPLRALLDLGATIWAVDLPRPELWKRLIKDARGRAGRLMIPVVGDVTADSGDDAIAEAAGANLLTDGPEIRTWLLTAERPLAIGAYAYMNGKRFVQVTVAMDALMMAVHAERPETRFAWLLTPTDSYAVPQDAADRSQGLLGRSPVKSGVGRLVNRASQGRLVVPNVLERAGTGHGLWGLVDCFLLEQGPNYTLAKRIQRWRAMVAQADGICVSCNVAPATRTVSVMQKRMFRAGYLGSEAFGVEIFDADATNALMAGMLVADLQRGPCSSAGNPHQLFMDGAMHGGMWRMPYQLRSTIHFAVAIGLSPVPPKVFSGR